MQQKTIALPAGFDPSRHSEALAKKVVEALGPEWELSHIDPKAGRAVAVRSFALTEIDEDDGGNRPKTMRLQKGTKMSDGEKVAARFADMHPGYTMTRFQPHLGTARLESLTNGEVRCRSAVAVAVGVKPWDIGVSSRPDGGYDLDLPDRYVPSKHDGALEEVATAIVGHPGWWVDVDPAAKTASVIPGDPPTFPAVVGHPMADVGAFDVTAPERWARIPLGVRLAEPGEDGPAKALEIDFAATPHCQISGLTGSGKGQILTTLVAGVVARGWEVVLVDAVKGGVDFIDLQPYVRPGGWAENLREAVCVLQVAYEEGQRRKGLVKAHGVRKFTELPAELDTRPLLVVVDEATSLILPEKMPQGVPKDSPLVADIAERNLLKATALDLMGKIARELRFVAVSLVMSTQVASSTTGIPTELRSNLGAKVLLGAKPTDNNRRLALSATDAVPKVPGNIADDATGAGRGVGVFEVEGQTPGVFKGYFSPPRDLAGWLEGHGAPTTDRPSPTSAEIARHTPSLDDDGPPMKAGRSGDDDDAGGRSAAAEVGDGGAGETCATCGTPVDPRTGHCRCSD